jgi:hypothetical protein
MEEEDWWIFCVGKSWKERNLLCWKIMEKRTSGSSSSRVMEEEDWWILCVKKSWRIGLVDLLCTKVIEEEDWWIFCVGKS